MMNLRKKSEWMDKERIKAIKERDNLLRKVRHSNEKNWKNALKMISVLGYSGSWWYVPLNHHHSWEYHCSGYLCLWGW